MSDKRKIIIGVALILFTLIILFYIMGSLFYAESLKVKSRDGFCPQGTWAQKRENIVIPGHTVILVDTSNKILEDDGKKAFRYIESWARTLPFLQKISIYGLSPEEKTKPDLIGKPWCVPKQGKTANKIYTNPRLVEVKFKAKFLARMQEILNFLVKREEAKSSPIIETIAYFSEQDGVDSLWIISDMLQHSSQVSHYGNSQDLGELCSKIKFDKIKIYYIDRGVKWQSREHKKTWEKCFTAGVDVEWV